jgi:hypothetical protein
VKKINEGLICIYMAAVACWALYFATQLDRVPAKPRNICSVAEISPDVTQQERERCRQIRGHKL